MTQQSAAPNISFYDCYSNCEVSVRVPVSKWQLSTIAQIMSWKPTIVHPTVGDLFYIREQKWSAKCDLKRVKQIVNIISPSFSQI